MKTPVALAAMLWLFLGAVSMSSPTPTGALADAAPEIKRELARGRTLVPSPIVCGVLEFIAIDNRLNRFPL